ncbi:unnamed protein product [Rotaria sp. Silwood2]|nr:unnamed protein product [Rotaria sp. Silwood2]CAF4425088.1 unnamed protein product [Rotaria sp. Silwood2]
MIATKLKGLNHIAPTETKNPELKKITTSPFARSETRYITPVTVNFADVGGFTDGNIILCDSPGFQDSDGPEADLANGIGVVNAIKECESVKVVVLISYKSIGDRCHGVKSIARVLSAMIPDIQDTIKAFSYIFTKFPNQERDSIHALLCDINNRLNDTEKSNASFTDFLRDMLQKTKKGARVLDPIHDDPGEVLDELARSASIERPEEVFHIFNTEESKFVVQEHVRKSQSNIESATKRFEYLFVKYKLDHLKSLNDLLHQDYIKLTYDNCVRFIATHLSQEYKDGISALDRYLMNQTVLSIEDIQTFQICAHHAELAEELRNVHLGEEVVHRRAFIQYLNQQVISLGAGPREKDINDVSVKTSLDKIKILSNFFPDVNKIYTNICQYFNKKLDLLVQSFKDSVSFKKFDQSASHISKFYDAIPILKDHLGSEDMELKYMELEKYFFKYLNDSTEELSFVFRQEKLEADDIDKLKNCISILETANNTFALQPYISKQTINAIYTDFLSKILKYVDEIIEKLNTQFNDENSFPMLEEYIAALDLIRTISIIEFQTDKLYVNTLEKLVGYLNKSKRNIEDQLEILFRHERKLDYDKLIKCLSSLKSAKWIEKYRTSVYTDVIRDVEQQIIEHINLLKASVMKVYLDLDNYDKIEQVYKIILEINDMKQLEKMIPNVNIHIDEVNSWFIKVTNNVFDIIKNTFNVEKWKEQRYEMLDFDKVEKAFCYLNIYKNISISYSIDYTSVLNSLEECIKEYSKSVQKEMEKYFENIKQYQNKPKEEIFEKARNFANCLQEIFEIKTKYSHIYSCCINKRLFET